MNEPDPQKENEIHAILETLRKRLRWLTVAVVLMALALFMCAASVFGTLVNYFAGDALLFGGVAIGSCLLGFAFGWFARRIA